MTPSLVLVPLLFFFGCRLTGIASLLRPLCIGQRACAAGPCTMSTATTTTTASTTYYYYYYYYYYYNSYLNIILARLLCL